MPDTPKPFVLMLDPSAPALQEGQEALNGLIDRELPSLYAELGQKLRYAPTSPELAGHLNVPPPAPDALGDGALGKWGESFFEGVAIKTYPYICGDEKLLDGNLFNTLWQAISGKDVASGGVLVSILLGLGVQPWLAPVAAAIILKLFWENGKELVCEDWRKKLPQPAGGETPPSTPFALAFASTPAAMGATVATPDAPSASNADPDAAAANEETDDPCDALEKATANTVEMSEEELSGMSAEGMGIPLAPSAMNSAPDASVIQPPWRDLRAVNLRPRPRAIQGIVLHDTAGSGTHNDTLYLAHPGDGRVVSVDFTVERNGDIWKLNPQLTQFCCLHAGRATRFRNLRNAQVNQGTVGIEIVQKSNLSLVPTYPQAQVRAVAQLCAWLLRRFSLSENDITTHRAVIQDGSRSDPRQFPFEGANGFKELLREALGQ